MDNVIACIIGMIAGGCIGFTSAALIMINKD